MSELNERLQELRELVYGGANPATWAKLWQALDRWDDAATLTVAVEYVQGYLEPWPHALRTLPKGWFDAPDHTPEDPRLKLLPEDVWETVVLEAVCRREEGIQDQRLALGRVADDETQHARLLWEGYRRGLLERGWNSYAFAVMTANPKAFDDRSLMAFLEHVSQHEAFGEHSQRWLQFGWHQLLDDAIDKLAPELGALQEGWQRLEGATRTCVVTALARHGLLGPQQMPLDALETLVGVATRAHRDVRRFVGLLKFWPQRESGTAVAAAMFAQMEQEQWFDIGAARGERLALLRLALPYAAGARAKRWLSWLAVELIRRSTVLQGQEVLSFLEVHGEAVEPELLALFDGQAPEAERLQYLVRINGPRQHSSRHLRGGGVGLGLSWWMARQAKLGRPIPEAVDKRLGHELLGWLNLFRREEAEKPAMAMVVSALQALDGARRGRVFESWVEKSGDANVFVTARVMEVLEAVGDDGVAFLGRCAVLAQDREISTDIPELLTVLMRHGMSVWPQFEVLLGRAVWGRGPVLTRLVSDLPVEAQLKFVFEGERGTLWDCVWERSAQAVVDRAVDVVAGWGRGKPDGWDDAASALVRAGEKAVGPICAVLEAGSVPQRELLVGVLADAVDVRTLEALARALDDSSGKVRTQAARGLAALGLEVCGGCISGALRGRSKRAREAAVEVVGLLADTESLRVFLEGESLVVGERSTRGVLLERLEALERTPPPDPLEALDQWLGQIPAERLEKLNEAIDSFDLMRPFYRRFGDLSPLELLAAVHQRQREPTGDKALKRTRLSAFTWGACDFHKEPLVGWLIVDDIFAHEDDVSRAERWLLRYEPPYKRHLAAPLARRLVMTSSPHRKIFYKWLADNPSPEAIPAWIHGLGDALAPVRRWCVQSLAAYPASSLRPALKWLLLGNQATRVSTAQLLEATADPQWIEPLQAALADKPAARFKAALEAALLPCRLLEVLRGKDLAAAKKAAGVAALFKKIKAPEPHSFMKGVKLCKLPMVQGPVLPTKAAAWLVHRLQTSHQPHLDPALAGVLALIEPGAALRLLGIIQKAFDDARRPTRDARVAITAQAMLGDDAQLYRFGHRLVEANTYWKEHALLGLNLLQWRATPAALLWLERWSRTGPLFYMARWRARAWESVVARVGLETDKLLDRALSTVPEAAELVAQMLPLRFERAMASQERWDVAELETMAQHPVAGPIMADLCWWDVDQACAVRLKQTSETRWQTLDGAAHSPKSLTVLHPLEVPAAVRARLQADDPNHPQVTRPLNAAAPLNLDIDDSVSITYALQQAIGWGYLTILSPSEHLERLQRELGGGFRVSLILEPHFVWHLNNESIKIQRLRILLDGHEIPWEDAPARVRAEIAFDLQRMRELADP